MIWPNVCYGSLATELRCPSWSALPRKADINRTADMSANDPFGHGVLLAFAPGQYR
jgi:hypothetical protein